jgi:hypothetical protein
MNKNKMQEQMDLFGGLKDEGGKVDRKSGNKVPIGSTKKEVRDDIPAQLSEGEFVLPADVVRYHGLEKLMKLRQQAKGGLKTMDKMGQMGNADEATLPDDIPFKPEFQQGGAVQAPVIQAPQVLQSNVVPGFQRPQVQGVQFNPAQGQQQLPSNFAPIPQAASIPFVQQTRAPVYTPPSYQEPISFKDYIGAEFGQLQKTETKKYVNEQGDELFIPFVNGKPIYPIPAGYSEFKEEEARPPTDDRPTTTTTRVREDEGSDDDSTQTGIKTTRVSKIASDAAGGKKSVTGFFSSGKGKAVAGSVLGMSMLGPVGAVIGGLLGKALTEEKGFTGAIPGTTAPVGPERDFEQLSKDAYGKSIADMSTTLGGVTPTFSYGYNPGDVDVATGGTFNSAGIAVDENGNMSTSNGVPSYASFSDFVSAMSASAKTGYYGGPVSKAEYDNMSPKGKDLYDAYATETNQPSYGTKDPDVDDISDDVDTTPSPTDPSGIDFGVSDPDPVSTVGDDPVGEPPSQESIVGDDPTGDPDPVSIVGDDPVDDSTPANPSDPSGMDFGVVDQGDSTGGGPGCVIATHGLSTGGFTAMEKAKAELWCAKTYHGKWYGEAFRRGYRAAGMKHINAGTAPSVYQEFKDFVAYGRGIKKGWKIGFNYYLRTIAFFIHGLFIK